MKRLLQFVLLLLLAGCGAPAVPYVAPQQLGSVSMQPSDWWFLWSQNMPAHPSASSSGWMFVFPASGGVDYVQVPFTAGATLPASIAVTFRVDESAGAQFAIEDPNSGNPAMMHLMMERRGDNGTQDYYRWWYDGQGYVLGQQSGQDITITASLDWQQWSSVYGHHDQAEFANTLNNLQAVGMTFGGSGAGWGHGVLMAEGSATFTLLDYEVR